MLRALASLSFLRGGGARTSTVPSAFQISSSTCTTSLNCPLPSSCALYRHVFSNSFAASSSSPPPPPAATVFLSSAFSSFPNFRTASTHSTLPSNHFPARTTPSFFFSVSAHARGFARQRDEREFDDGDDDDWDDDRGDTADRQWDDDDDGGENEIEGGDESSHTFSRGAKRRRQQQQRPIRVTPNARDNPWQIPRSAEVDKKHAPTTNSKSRKRLPGERGDRSIGKPVWRARARVEARPDEEGRLNRVGFSVADAAGTVVTRRTLKAVPVDPKLSAHIREMRLGQPPRAHTRRRRRQVQSLRNKDVDPAVKRVIENAFKKCHFFPPLFSLSFIVLKFFFHIVFFFLHIVCVVLHCSLFYNR